MNSACALYVRIFEMIVTVVPTGSVYNRTHLVCVWVGNKNNPPHHCRSGGQTNSHGAGGRQSRCCRLHLWSERSVCYCVTLTGNKRPRSHNDAEIFQNLKQWSHVNSERDAHTVFYRLIAVSLFTKYKCGVLQLELLSCTDSDAHDAALTPGTFWLQRRPSLWLNCDSQASQVVLLYMSCKWFPVQEKINVLW